MTPHLHIVCLDVPYPPDYGGVFDLFYKLKYLKEEGVHIHLHCFEYGRGKQDALQEFCETVHYYKRKKGIDAFSPELPYIVSSRNDKALKENLAKDDYPVLLEGIHCTYWLYRDQLVRRKVILRAHNVEFEYYRQLAANERSLLKKAYYINESRLLRKYESQVAGKAGLVLTVSEKDVKVYENVFRAKFVKYLPVFIPWNEVSSKTGAGKYCLYHANLSINENEQAALWLIEKVFANADIPLIIAGKAPAQLIISAANKKENITVIADPQEGEMEELISHAHINVLPSFSNTGIKLKLLHALFCGRHCIVNTLMTEGTGLQSLCTIAEDEADFTNKIQLLFQQPFTEKDIATRQQMLKTIYDNQRNARRLAEMLAVSY